MTAPAGDTLDSKRALRRELRLRRVSIPGPARRRAACAAARHALRLVQALRARDVALYLPAGSELDTRPLLQGLWSRGCRCWVPQIGDRVPMRFLALAPQTALIAGRLGLQHPARTRPQCRRADLDLMFLPLVGFDARGYRLGQGGGYYDRWLARERPFRRPLRVGYAYALQAVPRLPIDPWDRRLHAVVTEQGITQWPTG